MKKSVSIIILTAIILSFMSFPSFAAPSKKGYSAGTGASYLLDVDKKIDEKYYEFSDGRKITLDNINDEDFIVLEKPYETDSKSGKAKKNSTFSLTLDAANITYKAINQKYLGEGIPEGISIGSDTENVFIGFRIKIEDNRPAYSSQTSTMRISLKSALNKTTALTTNYSQYFYWLDLVDGSMTPCHSQSGYMPANKNRNPNSRTSGIEFVGDMDGYLFIPLKTSSTTVVKRDDLQRNFKNIVFEFRTGDTDVDGNPAKDSSWENKAFLLGDGFIVNSLESFSRQISDKRESDGEMYSPLVDDTAFYAMRVGGYRSFDQVRVGDAFGKMPLDAKNNTPSIESSRQFVHITTLPNGDRARELILNSKNNSSVVDSKGNPYTSGEAMLSMYDNYDNSKTYYDGAIYKHGVRTKGVPKEIDLSGVKYLAFRVATKDGSKKNEVVKFSIRLAPSENEYVGSANFRTTPYYLTEGGITYLDANTLRSRTISVSGGNKDKLITVNGNLDGYLIIPIDRFNTKPDGSGSALDEQVIRKRWGAYFNYGNQGIYYCLQSGFENGKAFYAGDIFFVSDKEQFIDVRKTDCGAIGHKIEAVPEEKATCKSTGISEGRRCSACDLEIRGFETTDKLPHDYKLFQTVEPSKDSEGYQIYKCQACGSQIKKDYGEKIEETTSSSPNSDSAQSTLPGDAPSDENEQNPEKNEDEILEEDQNNADNNLIIIIIIVVLAVLLLAGTVVTIILVRKKKK